MRPHVEVIAYLVEGVHDALIELRNQVGAVRANRIIAHIAETLIEDYPMMVSDMQCVPVEERENCVQAKIILSRKRFPRLVACYESLPWGVQSMVVLSLMNRLYMLGEADPSKVEEVMRRRAQGGGEALSDKPAVQNQNPKEGGALPPIGDMPIAEEIILTDVPKPTDESGVGSMLTSDDDPLIGLNFGSF